MWKQFSGSLGILGAQALRGGPLIYRSECKIHRWVRPTLQLLKIKLNKYGPPVKNQARNEFAEWNQEAELYAFGKRLHEEFDPQLLRQAFTQRSYIIKEEMRQREVGIDNPELKYKDNRELIEQGDSFISEYIQLYIEAALPNFPKDGCTAVKNHLTSLEMLSHISLNLGTKDLIQTVEYPPTNEVLADTFKAIVAALLRSTDEDRAAHFVRDFVITNLNGCDVNELWPIENPIEALSSLLEKSGKVAEPRLIKAIGRNTILACYRVGIYIDKTMFCAGYGETVAIAHAMAAREGLKIYYGTPENMFPIDFNIPGVPHNVKHTVKKQVEA